MKSAAQIGGTTTGLFHVDADLSRRLEAVEEFGSFRCAEILGTVRPDLGCAVVKVAGGHASFAGIGSPVSQAVGIGLHGEVTAAELDSLEDFYFSRGSAAQIVVSPLVDLSLWELLAKRPYRFAEFNSVLLRPLSRDEILPPTPPGIEIVPVSAANIEQFDEVVARGFSGAQEPIHRGMFKIFASIPGSLSLLAMIDDVPAGGGGGLLIPEHSVAGLFGAATLPTFRNRGVQSALLNARLQLAARAGIDLAVVVTQPGTVSQRNAERAGFRLAYTKVVLVQDLVRTMNQTG